MTAAFDRPKTDRRPFYDPRSRNYRITPFVEGVTPKTVIHEVPKNLPLNQGKEGACAAFGWSAQLAVGPIFNPATNASAFDMYRQIQIEDRRHGRYFAEGATVLAGAEVARRQGKISGYKWTFGMDDLRNAIIAKGPVVLGVSWYDSMYNTGPGGRITINGPLVGGHCLLAIGYIHNHPVWGGNWYALLNSWGPTYGVQGVGYLREMDMAFLMSKKEQGEGCIADEIAPTPRRPWWYRMMRATTSPFRMDD